MGKWMAVNSAAIYGTSASPFQRLDWGRCTQKPGGSTCTFSSGPKASWSYWLEEPGREAYLLADPGQKPLEVTASDTGVAVKLPEKAPDPIASVIVLAVKGPVEVTP
jgi:alpha-L-fucosidase